MTGLQKIHRLGDLEADGRLAFAPGTCSPLVGQACKIQSKTARWWMFGICEAMPGLGEEVLGLLGKRGEVDGAGWD